MKLQLMVVPCMHYLIYVFLNYSTCVLAYNLTSFISNVAKNHQITVFGCNRVMLSSMCKWLSVNQYESRCILKSDWLITFNKYWRRHLFVIDLDCSYSLHILKQANTKNLFSLPYIWLAIYRNKPLEDITTNLENVSINLDSNFILLKKNKTKNKETLHRIFKKHHNDNTYKVEKYLPNQTNSLANMRKNVGITLNVCFVFMFNDSLNHLTDRRDKHIDPMSKTNYVAVVLLASMYNLTLNISIKNTWGYKTNDSRWTGMMGELVSKQADIGGTSLFMIKERVHLIEYISMVTPTKFKFVFRQPKLSYVRNIYLLPFDTRVWMLTFALICIINMCIYGVMKFEKTKNPLNDRTLDSQALKEATTLTIRAVCQQGSDVFPTSTSGRIATLVLFISLMFMFVSYSANIVALLQSSSDSINSLQDLLSSRITLGVHDTVYSRVYFAAAKDPIRKAIYEQKVAPPGKPPNFIGFEQGIKKLRAGQFAFHMELGVGYKLIGETFREDEKCGFKEIDFFNVVDPWLAIQKNSSYKEILKIGLRILRESGIQQRENNLIYTKKPTCSFSKSQFINVSLVDCYPAFVFLTVGIVVTIIVFLIELYMYYNINNNISLGIRAFREKRSLN